MIKRLIRLLARRTANEHAQSSWLEVLHLQWRAMQSLAIGAMWLCVMLFLLEGARPAPATHLHVHLRLHLHLHLRMVHAPSPPQRRTVAPPWCAGRSWIKLMSRWLVQMAFSFVVVDVGVVYLRYNLYCAFKSRFVKRAT